MRNKDNFLSRLEQRVSRAVGIGFCSFLPYISGCVQQPQQGYYTDQDLQQIESENVGAGILEGTLFGLSLVAPNLRQAAALAGTSRAVGAISQANTQIESGIAARNPPAQQNAQPTLPPWAYETGRVDIYLAKDWKDDGNQIVDKLDEMEDLGATSFKVGDMVSFVIANNTNRALRGYKVKLKAQLEYKEGNQGCIVCGTHRCKICVPMEKEIEFYKDVVVHPREIFLIQISTDAPLYKGQGGRIKVIPPKRVLMRASYSIEGRDLGDREFVILPAHP